MLITEVNHRETFKEERNKLSTSVSHKYQIWSILGLDCNPNHQSVNPSSALRMEPGTSYMFSRSTAAEVLSYPREFFCILVSFPAVVIKKEKNPEKNRKGLFWLTVHGHSPSWWGGSLRELVTLHPQSRNRMRGLCSLSLFPYSPGS